MIETSKIFNATEDAYMLIDDRIFVSMRTKEKEYCKTPFTFINYIGNYPFLFYNGPAHQCGYETCDEAEKARIQLLHEFHLNYSEYVFVVLKNNDFTEGNGSMVIDKIFKKGREAHNYVMHQKGIMGSSQHCNIYFGINIKGELYGNVSYNGYRIQIMEIK